MSNDLQNAFPALVPVTENPPVEVGPVDADKDFENSRKNLIQMMETTVGAIKTLSMLAQQSQMPDAFDVLNKMIKTYNDQQEQLIRMYRIKATREEKQAAGVFDLCDVCKKTVDICICPECPECEEFGRIACYDEGHLTLTKEIIIARDEYRVELAKQALADAEMILRDHKDPDVQWDPAFFDIGSNDDL